MVNKLKIKKTYIDKRIKSIKIKLENPTVEDMKKVIEELVKIRSDLSFDEILEIAQRYRNGKG